MFLDILSFQENSFRVGVEISDNQYFEIKKFPMLKFTRGPVIRFLYLRNYLFIFFKII